MRDYEMFLYCKKELLKRKTRPYTMANRELAQEFFETFKEEYPTSSLHTYNLLQFICLDNRARKNLVKMLKARQEDLKEQLNNICNIITEIQEGKGDTWK